MNNVVYVGKMSSCPLKSISHIILIVPKLISDIIEKLYNGISVVGMCFTMWNY